MNSKMLYERLYYSNNRELSYNLFDHFTKDSRLDIRDNFRMKASLSLYRFTFNIRSNVVSNKLTEYEFI